MEKYILLTWPAIQDFMEDPDYEAEIYSACDGETLEPVWFVPEEMYNRKKQQ